ncbi:MAG: sugar ABC transporter permease [Actinomycetota bacterium]|nr:sugar ABC transporter permease [Actinomycetota bacterium]
MRGPRQRSQLEGGVRLHYHKGLLLLLAPFVVGSLLLVVLPAVASAWYALTSYDALSAPEFRGLGTLRGLFRSDEFADAVRTTAVMVAVAVPLRIGGALLLALFLNRRERLAAGARTAAFMPVVLPDAATALVWLWVVNPVYGPAGALARGLGWEGPLLLDPWGARLTLVAVSSLALGEGFLVLLAARRELPDAVYDVARLEGASRGAVFQRVTLPLLAPVLGFLVARDLVMSLQVTLVPTLLLTNGGPLNATRTLPLFVYEQGFFELRLGEAAAAAVILFGATLVLVAVELLVLRRWLRALGGGGGGRLLTRAA